VLHPRVIEAIDTYLKVLAKKKLPAHIASAIQEMKGEYAATRYLRPTQVALLQRCFCRARAAEYEADLLPIDILDDAIAQELDGRPCQMLRSDEIAKAIDWLAIPGDLTDAEVEWHHQIQDQLLLTGWLSQAQLTELKFRYLTATGCWIPLR